ncbi:MAG: TonB family protein [Betaproteobacteria bacterium]
MRRLRLRVCTVWTLAVLGMAMTPVRAEQPLLEEQKPPSGKGLVLSESQVRYCLAQIIRIDAVRPVLDPYEKAQVDYFNQVVADYNGRCASYRYRGDTLEREKAPIEANRVKIEIAARTEYGKRFVTATPPAKQVSAPRLSAATTAARPPAETSPAPRPSADAGGTVRGEAASAPGLRVASELATAPAVASSAASDNAPQREPIPTQETDPIAAPPAALEQQQPLPPESAPTARRPAPGEGDRRASTPSTVPPGALSRKTPDRLTTATADKRKSGKMPSAAPASAAPSTPPAQSASATTPTDKPAAIANAQPTADPDNAMERFTQQIQRIGSEVLDERDYPEAARNKNLGGTSLIEVRFATGGYVKSINLSRSSGVLALDDKALDLARALRFPDVPKELAESEFSVRFPIVFRPR